MDRFAVSNEMKDKGAFERVIVVTLEVNGAQIMAMLRPSSPVLQAEIV